MAVVDPYSLCPCGSGQKFKWCCHKVEAHAERAQRLFDSGQVEAAITTLDEGLKKEADNAWLLTLRAVYLTRAHRLDQAKESLQRVIRKTPKHLGAHLFLVRLVIETEGPSAALAQFQAALTAVPDLNMKRVASLVQVLANELARAADFPAALAHLRLVQATLGDEVSGTLRMLEDNSSIAPWLKNPDRFLPASDGLGGEARTRFDEAVGWADAGLWSSAAAAFETLSSDPVAGPLADRNLGFCRLRLADDAAAVAALRRYVARLGPTTEAVDLEALCQSIAPVGSSGKVDQVHLTWPLRNRAALLAALRADLTVNYVEPELEDEDTEGAPAIDEFELLDRPALGANHSDLRFEDVPRIVGRVLVGNDTVSLEVYDDGRLEGLADRFTALAGPAIPPAHPKTKTLGSIPRIDLALMWEWLLPPDIDMESGKRLTREQGAYLLREVWPKTPHPSLRGQTPLQAAASGDAEVPLRAALLSFEQSREDMCVGFDFSSLRRRLNLPDEPEVDPETVDVETLHLARFPYVPAAQLSDERLAVFYRRARQFGLAPALRTAALALSERPAAMALLKEGPLTVYSDLASLAAADRKNKESAEWLRRGRQSDPPAQRAANAPHWDMLELRLLTRSQPPEAWVPELAVIMERHGQDREALNVVMMNLVDMGLLQLAPNPDQPGEMFIDSRPLQAVLATYGPRVTTSSGRLGVSATKPEIWTPGGGPSTGGGGLYVPGSGAPSGSEGGPSKLILPGR
jgi:tetratricopeptide (TPR) repeat protein